MEEKNRKWLVVVAVMSFILFNFAYYSIKYGWQGFNFMFSKLMTNIFWLVIIGVIGAIAYFLFFYEKKVDANYEVYNKILQEASLVSPDNLLNLYLSGDKKHKSIKIGKIVGLSIRSNYSNDDINHEETIFKIKPLYSGWIGFVKNFFVSPILIRCPSEAHDTLNGNVFVKCTGLVMHGYYFYPNTMHLRSDVIDNTIYYEAERFINLDLISKIL